MPPTARGQSLVLACLYLLLIVVMVLMTLGISQRVRGKIELNTLADTTAYSNAVATARAYNAVALMNRAAIAHWINLAGVESLISWTGLVFAEYHAIMRALFPAGTFQGGELGVFDIHLPGYASTSSECQLAMANVLWSPMYHGYWNMNPDWVQFLEDAALAGEQGRKLQDAIANLKSNEEAVVADLRGLVGSHALGTQIAGASRLAGVAPLGSLDAVNVSPWLDPPQTGLHDDKVWWAVMDARSPWVKNRSNDPISKLESSLDAAFAEVFAGDVNLMSVITRNEYERVRAVGSVTIDYSSKGHGCFGRDFPDCEAGPDWTNALAEDEATLTVHVNIQSVRSVAPLIDGRQVPASAGVCPPYQRTVTISNKSQVRASDIHHDDDFAFFDVSSYGGHGTSHGITSPTHSQLNSTAITRHTMGPCTDNFLLRPCHSVYVNIVSLDHGAALGGQAKNYAGLSRSAGAAPRDPWELKLQLAGAKLDLGAPPAQVSVGTGVAYYHRRGRFTETPNLFNPYWRATLVGAQRGVDDLSGLPPAAADAWSALKAVGYRGEK